MEFKQSELDLLTDQLSSIIFNASKTTSTKIIDLNKELVNIFASKRDILKFVNSLLLVLSLNKDHIYLPDLFILEIIKLKSSSLYELIASNDKYLYLSEENDLKMFKLYPGNNEKYENDDLIINSHRTGLFDIMEKIPTQSLKSLVNALFEQPLLKDYKSRTAISLIDNFERYFIYALPKGSFSFTELDDLIYEND